MKCNYGRSRTDLTTIQGARTWCGHGVFAHNLVKITALPAWRHSSCGALAGNRPGLLFEVARLVATRRGRAGGVRGDEYVRNSINMRSCTYVTVFA